MQCVFQNDAIFCIHISQGSVATCLKRGGIFKHELVANVLPSRLVKNFENRMIVSEVMAKSLVSCFLLTHGVVYTSVTPIATAMVLLYRIYCIFVYHVLVILDLYFASWAAVRA